LTWPSGAGRSSLRNRRNKRRPRRGRSGSLVLPRPLPGRCASPRWPSRSSDGAAPSPRHLAMTRSRADPRGLGSPSEHSSAALVGLSSTSSRGIRRCWPPRPRLSPQPETRTPHPSTDPSAEAMGDCRPSVHSRRRCRLLRLQRYHLWSHVPSSWFRTTSTVSSARRLRACCIPLPVMGFAAFRASPAPSPTTGKPIDGGRRTCRPRSALHTPRRILGSSRTTSPWPLPPCRWLSHRPDPPTSTVAGEHLGAPPVRSLDFGALLRRRVRTRTDRCRSNRILSFPGLCSPSKSFLPADEPLEPSTGVPHAAKIRR
jgi:hypothetical protein